jgi:hypothetical protein
MQPSSQHDETPQSRREWSDIQQAQHQHSTTPVARKRKWARIGRWAAFVALAAGLCGALVYASLSASRDASALEPAAALSKITFRTDGVLNDKWLAEKLSVQNGMSMNKVDIASIRRLLESQGQIKSAIVTLKLPNELAVEIRERMPVLRVQAQIAPGIVKTLLISDDGVLYEGANYPANTIRALPYVDGIQIRKLGNAYENIVGIEPIATLLNLARRSYPDIYKDWYIVSLRRYKGPDSLSSLIDITSRSTGKLVFVVGDFDNELRRLAIVLRNGATADQRQIVGIDMSVPGQVIVDYDGTTPPPTTRSQSTSKSKTQAAKPQASKQSSGTQPSKGR